MQTKIKEKSLSPLVEKTLTDVHSFHWNTTTIAYPVILAGIGWLLSNMRDKPNEPSVLKVDGPVSYVLLGSVILISMAIVWRTFTSITLWRLNVLASEFDPQYKRFIEDNIRLFYNLFGSVCTELPLLLYSVFVLFNFTRQLSEGDRLWDFFDISALIFFSFAFFLWLISGIQIVLWKRSNNRARIKAAAAKTIADDVETIQTK